MNYTNYVGGMRFRDLANFWVEYQHPLDNPKGGIKGQYPVVYCHIHDIPTHRHVIENIAPKVILISHNSDGGVKLDGVGLRAYDIKVTDKPHNVVKWYSQNVHVTGYDFLVPLPVGLENRHLFPYDKAQMLFNADSHKNNVLPDHDIYANMKLDTNPTERIPALSAVRDNPNATIKLLGNGNDYESFIEDIIKHKAVLSPRGNGLDCHRTYESLYLKRIPIMTELPSLQTMGLPIVFLPNWGILKHEPDKVMNIVHNYFENFDKQNLEAITMPYWAERIADAR